MRRLVCEIGQIGRQIGQTWCQKVCLALTTKGCKREEAKMMILLLGDQEDCESPITPVIFSFRG